MDVGLVGAQACGKTTLFELLSSTHGAFLSPDKANTATVDVPDERVDQLSALFKPPKITYAKITFTDINHLSPGDRENNNQALGHLKLMDALAVVVNGFGPGRNGAGMKAELEFCLSEMIFSDLEQVERKLQRLQKSKPATIAGRPEAEVFQELADTLGAGKRLAGLNYPADLFKELQSYSFLTLKPLFVVINLSEEQGLKGPQGLDDFLADISAQGLAGVRVFAKLEKDLQELPPEERASFAAEYQLPLDGKNLFIQQAYATAGFMSFLTAGDTEVRAWTVRQGCPIREAAGVIHKDLMNFFVRAEVIHYQKLLECGSEHEAVKRGWMRSEKKEYALQDGDVVHILASK
ncbi:MAG: DUF933 domain-containing protein [candidate division FCPU426 bacterium]